MDKFQSFSEIRERRRKCEKSIRQNQRKQRVYEETHPIIGKEQILLRPQHPICASAVVLLGIMTINQGRLYLPQGSPRDSESL